MRPNTVRPLVRFLAVVLFAAGAFTITPDPAWAQPTEAQTEEILNQANNAASIAEQLAMQGGQIAGRTGSRLASASGSMVTILTNFDTLACGTSVMALSVQMRNITMAAATAQPPDPQLDQLASRLRDAVAQLQALCNRYVHGVPTGIATGAGAGSTGAESSGDDAGASAGGPTTTVEERICRQRCEPAYAAFLDAQRAYERALRDAQRVRQNADGKRQTANQKAAEAAQAEADAEQDAADYQRLQAELTAAGTQAERMRIAGELANIHPASARRWAEEKRQEANQAEQEAAAAESAATRAEGDASAKYEIMRTLYEEWKRCAESCAEQARLYSRVTVDIWSVFTGAPRTLPSPPPFYRPRTLPAPTQQSAVPDTRTSRLVIPPAALAGGMLSGVVLDAEEEPREETQIAIDMPGGNIAETATGPTGAFAIAVPEAAGRIGFMLFDGSAEGVALEVMDGVPSGLPATPGDFIQAGGPVVLGEPYRAIAMGEPGGIASEVPIGTAIGPDGESGMTALTIPAWVQPGPVEFNMIGADGQEVVIESQAYTFVEAWLERDKLMSGESAGFGYSLDFGDGPGQVVMTIAVTGAIAYAKAGQPQVLQLDEEGQVTFTDTINALEGTPAGAPFAIIPAFTRGN